MSVRDAAGTGLGMLMFFGFLAYGLTQLVAAWFGLDDWIGGWSWLVLFVCFMGRFMLPITVAAFMGAWQVWQWHWALALLFAAPGLIVAVPALLAGLFELLPSRSRAPRY